MVQTREGVGDPAIALHRYLAAAGHLPAESLFTSLSGGRTNRLWQVRGAGPDLVVKLYAAGQDNPLFPNDPAAEALVLTDLRGTGMAPDLVAACETPQGPVVIYRHVEGTPWRDDPTPVARVLARLHARPAPAGLRPAADGSAALARDTRAILARCPAESAAPLFDLAPRGSVPRSGAACLLHGDAVPGNLIRTRAGIALIDWQCPAVGDPVHDLAVFLSPAMQLIYRGSALSPAETAGFLGGYGRTDVVDRYRALAPWLHWRIAAYCLWRSTQAAADYEAAMALELQHLSS